MTGSSFDSSHAIRFDLGRGAVRAANHDEPLVLVPAATLLALLRAAPADAGNAAAREIGSAIGRRAAARVGAIAEATVEAFAVQFAGEAALAGLGRWSLERWGRALVVLIESSLLAGALLASVVAAAVEAATGRRVCAVLLTPTGGDVRILIANEAAGARMRDMIANGASFGDALARLHGGPS